MPFHLGKKFTSHFNLLSNICSSLLVGSETTVLVGDQPVDDFWKYTTVELVKN